MQIGVIGGGPRGLAVMERILARFSKKHLQKRKKLSVAWFEDTVFGAGENLESLPNKCIIDEYSGFSIKCFSR